MPVTEHFLVPFFFNGLETVIDCTFINLFKVRERGSDKYSLLSGNKLCSSYATQ